MINISSDLQEIVTQALNKLREKYGNKFDIKKVNLAELERMTNITRGKLRKLKENNFIVTTHGNSGKTRAKVTDEFSETIDYYLKLGVTNSAVIFEHIVDEGYKGGVTSVKTYISNHIDLVPAKRAIVESQGNRGIRYTSKPGESYQMDWGFVNITTQTGSTYRVACFAMIDHYCGTRYIEFFPNAKQESLFIGMIHAFAYMGIPESVLTDNMKSVVIKRDSLGKPIWQKDYEAFMNTIGFKTKLCKPRHPFTKGQCERLVRFVKDNFIAGRVFSNITDLNVEALNWCNRQNNMYHACIDGVPFNLHKECALTLRKLEITKAVNYYLYPERKISFDGFVNYEGRRFGVPAWYIGKTCRVKREDFYITIYDNELNRELVTHNVTWKKRDSFCIDQYVREMPEEFPTSPVKVAMKQLEEKEVPTSFDRFNFSKRIGGNK